MTLMMGRHICSSRYELQAPGAGVPWCSPSAGPQPCHVVLSGGYRFLPVMYHRSTTESCFLSLRSICQNSSTSPR
jgi:hypothetical protein